MPRRVAQAVRPAIRRLLRRLGNAFWPGRAEDELARETAAHLALLEEDLQRRGCTAEAARVEARKAFGGIEQMKDRHRDARSFLWLDDARRDLGYAIRMVRREPLFALTAALSLAIGIGAAITVFTVGYAVLFAVPPGVADPSRVVDIGTRTPGGGFGSSSYPDYLDLQQRTTTLDGVFAATLFPHAMSLSAGDGATASERIFGSPVTANYFTVLGAVPAAGRLFDARDAALPVGVLSYGFWTRRFNRNAAVVGATLILNGRPVTVIGVAADGFHGTGIRAGDLWVPLATMTSEDARANRRSAWLLLGGRLEPGASIAQAAAEADAIGRALAAEDRGADSGRTFRVQTSSPMGANQAPVAVFLALLMAIVTVVLIIACANLAGVLLARGAARRREIAVRLAIGAGRGRLVRQLLAETVMIVSLGGAAGLITARTLTSVVVSLLPALPFPIDVSMAIDRRAVVFTVTLVLAAA